jgi:hypothetical protein
MKTLEKLESDSSFSFVGFVPRARRDAVSNDCALRQVAGAPVPHERAI